MRGDVLSEPGRFGPLTADHPAVGAACQLCDRPLEVGDRPAMIEWAPAEGEEEKAAAGRAHNVECKLAHESCAFDERGGAEQVRFPNE